MVEATWKTLHMCHQNKSGIWQQNMWDIRVVFQCNNVVKVCEIREALHDWLTYSIDVIRAMTLSILENFDKYYCVCHSMMTIAFGWSFFTCTFQQFMGWKLQTKLKKSVQVCYKLFYEYQLKS